jgi:hypothetical protein
VARLLLRLRFFEVTILERRKRFLQRSYISAASPLAVKALDYGQDVLRDHHVGFSHDLFSFLLTFFDSLMCLILRICLSETYPHYRISVLTKLLFSLQMSLGRPSGNLQAVQGCISFRNFLMTLWCLFFCKLESSWERWNMNRLVWCCCVWEMYFVIVFQQQVLGAQFVHLNSICHICLTVLTLHLGTSYHLGLIFFKVFNRVSVCRLSLYVVFVPCENL